MTPFDAFPTAPSSAQPHPAGNRYTSTLLDAISDEAAVRQLYELATRGANDSPEFARLDSLVYERLMDTYERGAGTAGIIHMGAQRAT